jgi:hypothetical protein
MSPFAENELLFEAAACSEAILSASTLAAVACSSIVRSTLDIRVEKSFWRVTTTAK